MDKLCDWGCPETLCTATELHSLHILPKCSKTRSTQEKITDQALAWALEVSFLFQRIPPMLMDCWWEKNSKYIEPSSENDWKEGNEGLYVLIHGLNGHPCVWDQYVPEIRKKHPEAEIRVVRVLDKGQCGIEKAVAPILEMVRDYAEQHEGQRICLIGHSLGAAIAASIGITKDPFLSIAPMMVIPIAGVHAGTKSMNLLENLGLAKWVYAEEARRDVKLGSEATKDLLSRLASPLDEGVEREYLCIASHDDTQVRPPQSSLPRMHESIKVSYDVYTGVDHNSIIPHVQEKVVAVAVEWMMSF